MDLNSLSYLDITAKNVVLPDDYIVAKELANSLFAFPYQSPSAVPKSVHRDSELMKIISETYAMTRTPEGRTQAPEITPEERMRLQSFFKVRIFELLETCLNVSPTFAPAALLYPKVAEFNTRAVHRDSLISLYERFLPMIDGVSTGTAEYDFIKEDIKNIGGNCFEKVERHLADFHYELAVLYKKVGRLEHSSAEYKKAAQCCPQIYGKGRNKIKL